MIRVTVRQVRQLAGRIQAIIDHNHLAGLMVTENFLPALMASWQPVVTDLTTTGRVPHQQVAYWRGVSRWVTQVETHPEWVLEMEPYTSVVAQQAACQCIHACQAQALANPLADAQVGVVQAQLAKFDLHTQSVGELAMIRQYWQATGE